MNYLGNIVVGVSWQKFALRKVWLYGVRKSFWLPSADFSPMTYFNEPLFLRYVQGCCLQWMFCMSSSWRCLQTLSGHVSPVTSLSFSADGQSIISAGRDKVLHVWDHASGKMRKTLPVFEVIAIKNCCLVLMNLSLLSGRRRNGYYFVWQGFSLA